MWLGKVLGSNILVSGDIQVLDIGEYGGASGELLTDRNPTGRLMYEVSTISIAAISGFIQLQLKIIIFGNVRNSVSYLWLFWR